MSNNHRGVKRRFTNMMSTAVRWLTVKEAALYGVTNMNAKEVVLIEEKPRLTRIPEFVYQMKNLQQLYLNDNKFTTLPKKIGQLKNLRQLYLGNNKISKLPPEIGRLKNLQEIEIVNNKLVELPPEIGQLQNLDQLYLGENELTTLPPEIGHLKNLMILSLRKNELTTLPPEIGRLKNLMSLDLSGNELTTLPPEIGQLQKLKFLKVDNKLTSLPESFKNLPDNLLIKYGNTEYKKQQFMKKFVPKRINKNTELLNSTILPTNNIPRGKRVYLNIPSNVKNNGTLRRVYNKNGINQFLRGGEGRASLHGNNFTAENVNPLNNKNFNLQRIRVRLLNTPLNSVRATIEGVKNRLPPNVSRTDVNNVVRKIKPLLLNKIRNKLRTTPANNRRALLNRYKRDGLINNSDVL
jgi:hypothetical protein